MAQVFTEFQPCASLLLDQHNSFISTVTVNTIQEWLCDQNFPRRDVKDACLLWLLYFYIFQAQILPWGHDAGRENPEKTTSGRQPKLKMHLCRCLQLEKRLQIILQKVPWAWKTQTWRSGEHSRLVRKLTSASNKENIS